MNWNRLIACNQYFFFRLVCGSLELCITHQILAIFILLLYKGEILKNKNLKSICTGNGWPRIVIFLSKTSYYKKKNPCCINYRVFLNYLSTLISWFIKGQSIIRGKSCLPAFWLARYLIDVHKLSAQCAGSPNISDRIPLWKVYL